MYLSCIYIYIYIYPCINYGNIYQRFNILSIANKIFGFDQSSMINALLMHVNLCTWQHLTTSCWQLLHAVPWSPPDIGRPETCLESRRRYEDATRRRTSARSAPLDRDVATPRFAFEPDLTKLTLHADSPAQRTLLAARNGNASQHLELHLRVKSHLFLYDRAFVTESESANDWLSLVFSVLVRNNV
jgi:hypothetical protein